MKKNENKDDNKNLFIILLLLFVIGLSILFGVSINNSFSLNEKLITNDKILYSKETAGKAYDSLYIDYCDLIERIDNLNLDSLKDKKFIKENGKFISILENGEVIKTDNSTLVKVSSWYDNEMGYTCQMIKTCKYLGENL